MDTATLPPDLVARIDGLAAGSFTGGVTGAIVGIDDPARGRLVRAYGAADVAGAYLPAQRATMVVAVNAADGNAVLAQALWGQIAEVAFPGTLTSWPS